MVVLRAPGEVFVLRHSMGRRPRRDESVAWVERVDPHSLKPLARSEDLPGGPFWPGGLAAHANGSLHVVHGRHAHRLSAELGLLASRELTRPRPYNSFVVLADGTLAMKDIDRELRESARVTLLDPETLALRYPELELPEPSIARLSADGDALYAVGASTVWRYWWDGNRLACDDDWRATYHGGRRHSYGWDPVIAGGNLWFLDNGAHRYATTMRGAGVAAGAVRLIRVSLSDSSEREEVEVCGAARGTATNPPFYDAARRIAIAYDSGNGIVQAFRFNGG
jgi:sugar lactone lactonase YvrE